jgi:hypothetical protein
LMSCVMSTELTFSVDWMRTKKKIIEMLKIKNADIEVIFESNIITQFNGNISSCILFC